MSELELTVSRTIPASRDKVFNAWLSPGMLSKVMRPPGTTSEGARVTNDPVKGGRFSIVMTTPEKEIPHAGTYLEIDPYSRLAFTWESPFSQDDSVVTIDFSEPQPGMTDITLKQVKFRSEEARLGHIEGWTAILGCLAETIA